MTKRARASIAVVAASILSAGCSGGGSGDGPACQAGQHACGDACAADTSPLTCGARCEPCPGTANGEPACASGACGFACDSGYEPCASGCCAIQPPAGSIQFSFTWPAGGEPLAGGARLEVILPDRTEVIDAPATGLTLEGFDPGIVTYRLRLLDGLGQVLARGGGVAEVHGSAPAWAPISTDAAGLTGCDLVDVPPDQDLVVDVSEHRTLTVFAREGSAALLLRPPELEWSAAATGVAAIDAVTGEVTPLAPGFATIGVRCGVEAPSFRLASVVTSPVMTASTVLFVRDRTSPDTAPVAALAVDPGTADFDFTFRLDASATTDDQAASALRWRFDWEGDGGWDTAFGTRSVRFHKYDGPSSYTPVVQVVDGAGHAARRSLTLPVTTPSGVRIALDPIEWRHYLTTTRLPWFFATVTGAADTSITWSMLEGAQPVAGQCNPVNATTCELDPARVSGFYHLVATANADPTKKAMAEIEVINQPPSADCNLEVMNGSWTDWAILGQQVRLDGSAARDPERGPLTYHWYQEGPVARVDLDGTGASVAVGFGDAGPRTFGLEVTDTGGEVGTYTCGTVTWAPAGGIPLAQDSSSTFWDDPNMTVEYAFTAEGSPVTSYGMRSCSYSTAGHCWTRLNTETCHVEGTGVGAPYLSCGSGLWFVTGPESGAPHLWTGESFYGWGPVLGAFDARLSRVEVAVRGHNCLDGPICP